jgi:cell division protein FtsB
MSALAAVASGQPAPAPAAHAGGGADVLQLQKALATMVKENKTLKDEVKVLREKLEQIRRIA